MTCALCPKTPPAFPDRVTALLKQRFLSTSKIGVELNLEISTDKAGNVWMTVPGKNRELPALVSGSHADSVPQGGNYDGLAGIVAALTVARWMRETGYQPERDYTVLMMRMEESSWFGKCYVGSLGMTGQLTEKDLALKHRSNGKHLLRPSKNAALIRRSDNRRACCRSRQDGCLYRTSYRTGPDP